jgi:hypothetical protein
MNALRTSVLTTASQKKKKNKPDSQGRMNPSASQ